jgi:hypothetical protein
MGECVGESKGGDKEREMRWRGIADRHAHATPRLDESSFQERRRETNGVYALGGRLLMLDTLWGRESGRSGTR